MIKYPTFNHIVFIQNQLITQYGGTFGFRGKEGIGLLESALARPMTTAFGQEMYATLFSKAAAICHSLAKNHVFDIIVISSEDKFNQIPSPSEKNPRFDSLAGFPEIRS